MVYDNIITKLKYLNGTIIFLQQYIKIMHTFIRKQFYLQMFDDSQSVHLGTVLSLYGCNPFNVILHNQSINSHVRAFVITKILSGLKDGITSFVPCHAQTMEQTPCQIEKIDQPVM